MPRVCGVNFFSKQMTRATCCLRPSATSTAITATTNGRRKRLTTVLIFLPLGLITLILLCIFTSTSESAALTSSEGFSHSSFNNPNFNFTTDYILNLNPYPRASPKVFLKHNGESGMINPSYQHHNTNNNENFQLQAKQDRQGKYLDSPAPVSTSYDTNNNYPVSEETGKSNYDDHSYDSSILHEDFLDTNSRDFNFHREISKILPTTTTTTTPAPFHGKHWMEFLVDQTTFPYVAQPQLQLQPQLLNSTQSQTKAKLIFPSSNNKYFSQSHQPETVSPTASSPSPSYFYPYSSYSEEDLENVADFEDHHSKYFIKTKPKLSKANSDSIFNANAKRAIPSPSQSTSPFSPRPVGNHFHDQDDVVEHLLPFSHISHTKEKPPPITSVQSNSDEYDDEFDNYNQDDDSGGDDEEGQDYDAPTEPTSTTPATKKDSTPSSSTTETVVEVPQSTTATTLDLSSSASFSSSTSTNNLITDVTKKYGTTDATSIPGMPGIDYPILDEVPYTGFDCNKQRYKGFFADIDTKCQAWHYCDFTDGHSTFLCPNGTLFSQVLLTCDWWYNVNCKQAQQLYVLNERLYRYIKPPKPSFPEDYSGPQVDRWLIEQLQLGVLPKMKKKTKDKLTEPLNN